MLEKLNEVPHNYHLIPPLSCRHITAFARAGVHHTFGDASLKADDDDDDEKQPCALMKATVL